MSTQGPSLAVGRQPVRRELPRRSDRSRQKPHYPMPLGWSGSREKKSFEQRSHSRQRSEPTTPPPRNRTLPALVVYPSWQRGFTSFARTIRGQDEWRFNRIHHQVDFLPVAVGPDHQGSWVEPGLNHSQTIPDADHHTRTNGWLPHHVN